MSAVEPFRRLVALACPLPLSGVDTDQLIPARFMSRTRAEGYGDCLLHDLRFDVDGHPRPDFPLNDPARAGSRVLVARRNFGAGSSREAAVYALVDYGIRCVAAPSFGDIFAANAVNNGLLPVRLEDDDAERLLSRLGAGLLEVAVDLDACEVAAAGEVVRFAVDPVWRTKLLHGWDDLDLTLSHGPVIRAFAGADAARRPWSLPGAGGQETGQR
jgi:3-isopropylmalate/(R)-2-methylmalate dehydratase small subunit